MMNQRESIHERISEMRKDRNLTQKKLCEIADITPTQLSRIENGVTETISSDVLIKLSIALNVSADYLLGLTDIASRKNYEIGQLGLSEGAVETIVSGRANVNVLNALLENAKFSDVLRLANDYFMNTIKAGIMARNEIINLATSTLSDFAKANPKHITEVKKDLLTIKSHKLGQHEAEIEKIKSVFVAMLIEMKKELERFTEKQPNVNAEMLGRILTTAKLQKPRTIEELSELLANAVQGTTQMSDEQAEDFQQFAERFINDFGENHE